MPAEWNKKLLGVGNGGLAGNDFLLADGEAAERGYATSSTDTGHTGANTNDGGWALGHYERWSISPIAPSMSWPKRTK